jgi:hypothetical protein
MSGVLERMAKRALGRLPTVQPLIRSVYATGPGSAAEPSNAGFLPAAIEVKTSAAPSPRPPVRVSEPAAPPRLRAEQARTPDHLEQRAEPVPSQTRRQTAQRTRREPPVAPASEPEAAQTAGDPESMRDITITAPGPPMRADEAASIVEEPIPAAIDLPSAALVAQTTASVQRRRVQTAHPESAAPAEPKPEIHISIGSIELRAAPAEAKPPAPAPFRPRVSLHDFLSRKPEARR